MRSSASIVGSDPIPIPGEQAFELPTVKYCLLKMQAAQKDCLDHPPNPGVRHAFPGEAATSKRGGTYQASLEPLASINRERIGILPPVNRLVEPLSEARTKLAGLFQQPI
jgi:hypothetical protein